MSFESVSIPVSDAADAGGHAATLAAPLTTAAAAVLRVGLVGCGGFARFAVRQYRTLPGVSIEAVADIDASAAERTAAELDAAVLTPREVLEHPMLDLVYIATPPALHFAQASAAVAAGRHVLVEKPLATTVADAEALEALAARQGVVCVANLVERYCPLSATVRRLIESRLLGGLVHGLFLNEAGDEGLGPEHWFWDRDTSGGIFVEHGVHFFDLVASWLGAGHVVSAARSVRSPPGADPFETGGGWAEPFEEQVACTCRYPANHALSLPGEPRHPHSGILFHFEHGFHQPALLDRQEMRLVFERGELRLFDWVPTRGTLRALVDDETTAALAAMLPGPIVRRAERLAGGPRRVHGRFRDWEATAVTEIDFAGGDKMTVYAEAVRDLAADQIARIRDPAHVRRLTEAECVAAVALACEADRLALAAG